MSSDQSGLPGSVSILSKRKATLQLKNRSRQLLIALGGIVGVMRTNMLTFTLQLFNIPPGKFFYGYGYHLLRWVGAIHGLSGWLGQFQFRGELASSERKQLFTGRDASEMSHVESDPLLLAYNG